MDRRFATLLQVAVVSSLLGVAWPTAGQGQSCSSGGTAGSRFRGQVYWEYLCQWPVSISGTVVGIRYSNQNYTIPITNTTASCNPWLGAQVAQNIGELISGTEFCDNDLNLIIMPDPEFQWVSRNPNHDNRVNAAADGFPLGAIETEVRTLDGYVERFFPIGSHVVVEGWWVEDSGHDFKTELHPIRTISGVVSGTSTWVMVMTQDMSYRFAEGAADHSQEFTFSVPRLDVVDPNAGSVETSYAAMLTDSSILDGGPDGTFRSEYLRYETQPPAVLGVTLDLLEKPSFAVGNPTAPNQMSYLPFYLGVFDRDSAAVYQDSRSITAHTDNNGRKYIELTVDAGLLSTGLAAPLVRSRWSVQKGQGQGYEDTLLLRPPHQFHFSRQYGPASGKPDHVWRLRATGNSVTAKPNLATQGFSHIVSVLKERSYNIPPSTLRPGFETYEHSFLQPPPAGGVVFCVSDTAVRWEEVLLPSVQWTQRPRFWIRRYSGQVQPINSSGWTEITLGSPFEDEDVKVSVDPNVTNRFRLQWKGSGQRTLRATGGTDLGEQIDQRIAARNGCSSGGGVGLEKFFENIVKGLMAVDRLRALGLLPNPASQVDWRSLFSHVPSVPFVWPRLDRRGPSAPTNPAIQGFLMAASNVLAHQDVSNKEWKLLTKVADAVAPVPWSSPPPSNLLKTLSAPLNADFVAPRSYPSHVTIPWAPDSPGKWPP